MQFLGGVLVGAELGRAAGVFEFALVVPLLGEGHEEALLALFVLERHHCLLDVIVIRLELALEPDALLIQSLKRKSHTFNFPLALNSPPVLGADIDCDGIEQVLVVIMPCKTAEVFKLEYIFKSGAFEFGVGERSEVDKGVFRGVGGAFTDGGGGAGGEFCCDDVGPAGFVVGGDGLDHDFHEGGAGLNADDVEDASFGFGEEGFDCGVGVWKR